MKITIRPKKEVVEKKITLNEIKPGAIFEYDGGVVALKVRYNEVVLLKYTQGDDWFELADGYKTEPVKRILGRLDEIIVVEDES